MLRVDFSRIRTGIAPRREGVTMEEVRAIGDVRVLRYRLRDTPVLQIQLQPGRNEDDDANTTTR